MSDNILKQFSVDLLGDQVAQVCIFSLDPEPAPAVGTEWHETLDYVRIKVAINFATTDGCTRSKALFVNLPGEWTAHIGSLFSCRACYRPYAGPHLSALMAQAEDGARAVCQVVIDHHAKRLARLAAREVALANGMNS